MRYNHHAAAFAAILLLSSAPSSARAVTQDAAVTALLAEGEHTHAYANGFCTECGEAQADYVKPGTDGYYALKDGHDLLWWAKAVVAQTPNASARLVSDIDMSGITMTPIGISGDKPFQGTFDGQGHTISHLEMSGENNVGLFGYVTGGAYVKNFIVDATSSISGGSYCGVIGGSVGYGSVNIECIGMEGTVKATSINAGGIFGCCLDGCAILISDSYVTGKVTGGGESAAIAGWVGGAATLSNLWSCAEVEGLSDEEYLYRGGIRSMENCFAVSGSQGSVITREQLASGELTYRLNKGVVENPVWRQTLGSDDYPSLDKSHGIVFSMAADEYSSLASDKDVPAMASACQQSVADYCGSTIAEQALLDACLTQAEALSDCQDVAEFCAAYTQMQAALKDIEASAAVYARYMARCAEIKNYLASNPQLQGDGVDALNTYLEGEVAPGKDWPLGGYVYLTEKHVATAAQVEEEMARLEQAFNTALAGAYAAGQDITNLLTNPDLTQQPAWAGWDGVHGTGLGASATKDGQEYTAAESWEKAMDMHQTITGLRQGYYLVSMNGAYRHHDDPYSNTYSAQLYAGDNCVFLPTVYETRISADEAEDDVNCNISGTGTVDLPIYANGGTTSDEAPIAYALHGIPGMAYAIASGRAQNSIVAYVGEDRQLTLGIRLPDNGSSGNWLGFGNFHLTYCGDESTTFAADALAQALAGQTSRARTILDIYKPDAVTPEVAPNYPAAIREALRQAVDEAAQATSVAEKARCVARYSQLFDQINEARTAYLSLFNTAGLLESAGTVLKDSLTAAQYEEMMSISKQLYDAYADGTYSAQEAAHPGLLDSEVIRQYIPEIDANGVIHVASVRNMVFFSAYVNSGKTSAKARLEADIQGVTSGMALKDFRGTLDGAYHTITLNIDHPEPKAGLVEVLGGTVKNLYLEGTITTADKYAGSVAGTTGNSKATIQNVVSRVNIISTVEGDGTHGGLVGCADTDVAIRNSAYAGTLSGEKTNCCGGFVGWINAHADIENCLQVADVTTDATGGHTWARNPGNMTLAGSYYLNAHGAVSGTQVTKERLASGEVCYLLNGESAKSPSWYQTLGIDALPVPDPSHKRVGITYEGAYTNDESKFAVEHTGTKDDPYVLATVADLERMRSKMRLGQITYFVLNNDIDMSSISSWVPVNGYGNSYNGREWQAWIDLDGKGHVLRNLKSTGNGYDSFFGVLCGNVRNIGFEDVDIDCTSTGSGVLGGYVGHTDYSDADRNLYTCYIENVWVTGKLKVASSYCGGFFGNVGGPTVMRNCYANMQITSGASLNGGIVGRVREALTMENCYAAGTINAGTWGGIVGGGQKGSTPATTYKDIVVWNNTEKNFGGTAANDRLSGILYYDGANFHDLQQAVVAWDSKLWTCTMEDGAYPVLLRTAVGIQPVADGVADGRVTSGIYTLTGVRVRQATKGLYIINGRKVMVK